MIDPRVPRDKWIELCDLIIDGIEIPRYAQCIYVLYPAVTGERPPPFYVGSTEDLPTRLANHRERFGAMRVVVKFPSKFGKHLMIEARLIHRIGVRLYNIRGRACGGGRSHSFRKVTKEAA